MKWKTVRLYEIADLLNGFAFSSKDYIDESDTLCCRMSNIRPGGSFDIEYSPKFLPDFFSEKYKEYLLNDGDLILAMTDLSNNPKILGVPTIVKTNGKKILLNQRVGKLKIISEGVSKNYLRYALNRKEIQQYYTKFAGGGLQINLGKIDLLSVELPLPPFLIQEQIADTLDKADALRRKDQDLLTKYDELAQAIFYDMFGDPERNEMGWNSVELSELIQIKPNTVKPEELVNQIYIGLENIEKESGTLSISKETDLKSNKFSFNHQSILYGKLRPYLNKVALPDFSGVCSTDILPITCTNSNRYFIAALLKSKNFTSYATINSVGANLPRVKKDIIMSYKTINPPRKLQNIYETKVISVFQIKSKLLESSKYTSDLFNKLSNSFFS